MGWCGQFQVVLDGKARLRKESHLCRNRQIEFYAAGIDLETAPVKAVHTEVGALQPGGRLRAVVWLSLIHI